MKKKPLNISEEPHCHDLESLGSVMMPIIEGVLSAEDLVAADIMFNWINIVGGQTAAYCRPQKVKFDTKQNSRTLYVEVPVGGFALELQHREKHVLETINAYFGYNAIHKLNISQNIRLTPRVIAISKEKQKPPRELDENEKKYLEEISDGIDDEKLREILTKLGTSVLLSKNGAK